MSGTTHDTTNTDSVKPPDNSDVTTHRCDRECVALPTHRDQRRNQRRARERARQAHRRRQEGSRRRPRRSRWQGPPMNAANTETASMSVAPSTTQEEGASDSVGTALIYARTTNKHLTDDEDSVSEQLARCTRFAEELPATVAGFFADVATTKHPLDRDGLRNLLHRMGKIHVDYVICTDMGRLSHNNTFGIHAALAIAQGGARLALADSGAVVDIDHAPPKSTALEGNTP